MISFFYFNFIIYLVLDPRLKLHYYKRHKWEQEYIDQAKNIFLNLYNDNYSKADNIIINTQENINNNANDFFYEIFGAEDFNNSNEYEIEDYLNKPVERPDTNPLNWWKVNII